MFQAIGILAANRNRFAVSLDGILKLTLVEQRDSQIDQRVSMLGRGRQGLLVALLGSFHITRLMQLPSTLQQLIDRGHGESGERKRIEHVRKGCGS